MRKSVIVAHLLDAVFGVAKWEDELEEFGLSKEVMHYALTQSQSVRGRHSRDLRKLRAKPTSARTRREIRKLEGKLDGYVDSNSATPAGLEAVKQQIKDLLSQ